jgi:invasion protein IalB
MMRVAAAALIATLTTAASALAAAPGSQFKDWRLDCVAGPPASGQAAQQVCLIQHEVPRGDGSGSAMIARVRFLGEHPVLLFLLPPNMAPKTELSYGIDDGATATTAVKECNKQLCWAVVPIGEYLLASLKQGTRMVIRTPAAPKAALDVPLNGFTAAFDELERMRH